MTTTDPLTTTARALARAVALHADAQAMGAQARERRDARDAIIRQQLRLGATQREIAEALGLSPGMVAKIAHARGR